MKLTRPAPPLLAALVPAALALAGCSRTGAGGALGSAAAAPASTAAPVASGVAPVATPVVPGPAGPDFDALAKAKEARARAYLDWCVTATTAGAEGLFTQVARLELGKGPLARPPIEAAIAQIESRIDTADFAANGLLRILLGYAASPLVPSDLRDGAERALLGFRYAVEDPSRGEGLCLWSENHQILYATAEYLLGSHLPGRTFGNTGWTGAQHAARGRDRVLRWLDDRERFGFSEWYSPVYYTYDVMPLLNLVDFAPDPAVRDRAALVLDLLVFDLARLTHAGSFSPSAGRAYEESKLSPGGQSLGAPIEVLFGTRGFFQARGSPSGVLLAVSPRYRVPHVLLGIGTDRPAPFVDRSRSGIDLTEGPAQGKGFQTTQDGLFWWGMGAYATKEVIVLSKRMVQAHGLGSYPAIGQVFGPLASVPDALLPVVAGLLSPLAQGPLLSRASVVTYRSPEAMLSSVQDYRRGQLAFQTHAWQATLGLEAIAFTTAPGNLGHDGPTAWTGSGSLPRIVQVENVALILYDPNMGSRLLFPEQTHAYFPRAAFDEVASSGGWTFGRKGDGYVALWSALPASWTASGPYADRELVARGARNAWICEVGRRADEGSFAAFQARVVASRVAALGQGGDLPGRPLAVTYDHPRLGALELAFDQAPRRSGQPFDPRFTERFSSPYARVPFGARKIEIAHGGAKLELDLDRGTRAGRGL